jgi:hypothetical protein
MYWPFILAVRELRGHLELTQLMVEHMLMPLGQPFLHLMVEIDGGASANSILLNVQDVVAFPDCFFYVEGKKKNIGLAKKIRMGKKKKKRWIVSELK